MTDMNIPTVVASSPDTVTTQIVPFVGTANELLAMAERAVIDNEEALSRATDLAGIIKAQNKKADEAEKSLTSPLKKHIDWIRAQFNPTKELRDKADTAIRAKMKTYMIARDARLAKEAEEQKRIAEEAALAAASALEQSGNAEAANMLIESAASLPTAPVKAVPARGSLGASASSGKRWTYEVTDFSKLPDEYKEIAAGAVRKAINNGERDIPGLRIFQDVSLTIR